MSHMWVAFGKGRGTTNWSMTMNTAHNIDRSMVVWNHPSIDALEARIQSNVTVSRSGRFFVAEAACSNMIGSGLTVEAAIKSLIRAMGL